MTAARSGSRRSHRPSGQWCGRSQPYQGRLCSLQTKTLELARHVRIVMVGVSANYLFRPNQFLMRLEDFSARAGYKPDRNAAGDQWIEECVAG